LRVPPVPEYDRILDWLVPDGANESHEEIPPEESDVRFDAVQAEWREAFTEVFHDEFDPFADDPETSPDTVRVESVKYDAWE
jgi:hypothetical protein